MDNADKIYGWEERVDGWMDRWMDEWVNGRIDDWGWMNGWMNE